MSWTKLPFPARNRTEFSQGLTDWLGQVFYEILPEQGYEVREEQVFTAFRMARALTEGQTLFAEAGPGTGKTFAYLLPAVCYARFYGKPVLVAVASGLLQAQLLSPDGDIQTLSRTLDLGIDARLAADPGQYLCEIKAKRFIPRWKIKGARGLYTWARRTTTGARSEVPAVPDDLWAEVAWDPALPCDTCKFRGTCHVMAARRHYRAASDLVVADHRLFARDLLTRQERQETGQVPMLPPYAAAILDEGQHVPETWQRAQGYAVSARRLQRTLDRIVSGFGPRGTADPLAEARSGGRTFLADVLVAAVRQESERFRQSVLAAALPGEGKRHIPRVEPVLAASAGLTDAIAALQDELVIEEAMQEGSEYELTIRAYQARLDDVLSALALYRSPQVVPWVEGDELWVVPRTPLALVGPGRLSAGTPVIFSSATLEPAYMARNLGLPAYDAARVGVPFNLAEQVLVYQPGAPPDKLQTPADKLQTPQDELQTPADEFQAVLAVIRAMQGRTLVLLNSLAAVQMYKDALMKLDLPWPLLFEGDAERGAMLQAFRADVPAVLVGATYWEGVDVPGESLSCVVIPQLPFPAHDPLIEERRRQAAAQGEDPCLAVDVPEMLLKLKQGVGRLIRTASDRGVLALLDRPEPDAPWAASVAAILPAGAEGTGDLERVAGFCPPVGGYV